MKSCASGLRKRIAVTGDDLCIPPRGVFERSFLRVVIDVNESEAFFESALPFEVVEN